MKSISTVIFTLVTAVMAMPHDLSSSPDNIIVQWNIDHLMPNDTHAFIEVDGIMQTLDLTTPDVIRENGIIRKPIGPNHFLNASTEPHPDFETSGLQKRDCRTGDNCCSQYYSCNNEYIQVNQYLWSNWYTAPGTGLPLNGQSGYVTVNAPGSTVTGFNNALVFSYNEAGGGCHIQFTLNNCQVIVPTWAEFASNDCAGC
ncbi:hypothetical protein F5884DRAFT_898481 [Xylogone sp. PMI_703]|nr:hypothetical protein F5884DRAFT_898481 [Xylogone sp. PMI_703]